VKTGIQLVLEKWIPTGVYPDANRDGNDKRKENIKAAILFFNTNNFSN